MNLRNLSRQLLLPGLRPCQLRFGGGRLLALAGFCSVVTLSAKAQVPALLNYQGRINVGKVAFEGNGQFKLAMVNGDASQVYWRNAADANNDGEPDEPVSVPVIKGIYSIMLGDTNLLHMAALPASTFSHSEVYLRAWFNDGVNGFQLLSPDKRIASVGYAMIAGAVPDGTITTPKLESELAAKIASLSADLNILSARLKQIENSAGGGSIAVSTDSQDAALIAGGFQSFTSTTASPWYFGSNVGSPAARTGHTAIWSGDEMIVWGGYLGNDFYANSGALYDPGQDSWKTTPTFGAPSARQSHSAIWTGAEMILWGGYSGSGFLGDGGRYAPESQMWNPVSTAGAPTARGDHASVWTGSRMVVWGGRGGGGYYDDGGLYDPVANQWIPLVLAGKPEARHSSTAIWADGRMIVWGGAGTNGPLSSGGQLLVANNGATQQWQSISSVGGPSARTGHSAIWTGSRMIIWGGRNGSTFFQDGGLYDPVSNQWTALAMAGAPTARALHATVWTGSEMVVYGGEDASGALASASAYDPATNKWRPLGNAGGPLARAGAQAVWSGRELLVFGGRANNQPLAAVQRLDPQPAWYFYRKL